MGRILPDAADLVVWEMNENALPFRNKGSMGSSMDLTSQSAAGWSANNVGRTNACPYFPGGRSCYVYNDNTNFRPNYPITISHWIYLTGYMVWGMAVTRWTDSSWVGPYATWYPWQLAGEPGPRQSWWWALVKTDGGGGGAGPPNSADSQYDTVTGIWYHIGIVYDGVKIQTYWQGQKINENALWGNIVYNSGSVRTNIGASGYPENLQGYVDDIRIAGVARPASWFAAMYDAYMTNPKCNGSALYPSGGVFLLGDD